MPHFIVDCNEELLTKTDPEGMLTAIHDEAEASGLFGPGNVKVRILPFKNYTVGGAKKDFIHIIAHIMEGRTAQQKRELADGVVRRLKNLFPNMDMLSIDIRDIDKSSYSNRKMV